MTKRNIFLYTAIIIVSYTFGIAIFNIDNDLWARLFVGSLFFQTGWVFKHDIFAYTQTKDLWIDHEWLSGVVFYSLAKYLGNWGLLAFKILIIALIMVLAVKTIQVRKKDEKIDILTLILFQIAIFPTIASPVRSGCFTYLFFALWIYILERIRTNNENRLLWIFPVTTALWANLHGGFITGLTLLAYYGIGEFLRKKPSSKYFITACVSALAIYINPYGPKYIPFIIEAATMARPLVFEWQKMDLSGPNFVGTPFHVYSGVFILAFFTAWGIFKSNKTNNTPDYTKIILCLSTFIIGYLKQRHIIFFAISSFFLFYSDMIDFFKLITKKIFQESAIPTIIKIKDAIYIISIAILGICIFTKPFPELVAMPQMYPVGSVEFIKQNHLKGNISTPFGWGGYVFWKLYPNNLISVDGRYEEVYDNDTFDIAAIFGDFGGEKWKSNKEITENPKVINWQAFLGLYHTDIVILSKQMYSPYEILTIDKWQMVYEDPISVVLLPKNKLKKDYIKPDIHNAEFYKQNLAKDVDLN